MTHGTVGTQGVSRCRAPSGRRTPGSNRPDRTPESLDGPANPGARCVGQVSCGVKIPAQAYQVRGPWHAVTQVACRRIVLGDESVFACNDPDRPYISHPGVAMANSGASSSTATLRKLEKSDWRSF